MSYFNASRTKMALRVAIQEKQLKLMRREIEGKESPYGTYRIHDLIRPSFPTTPDFITAFITVYVYREACPDELVQRTDEVLELLMIMPSDVLRL